MGFSDSYIKLREKLLIIKDAPMVYTSAPALPPRPFGEKLVRALWFEQKFEKRNLAVTSGEKLRVVSPGTWNLDSGPDFKSSEFYIDGEKFVGDVEVHKFASDWKKHGHHKDKNFSGVKLHVFLVDDTKRKSKNTGIYQLCLGGYLTESVDLNIDDYPYQSFAGLGACGRNVSPSNFEFLEHFLDIAGEGRMILKSRRNSGDYDQAIYSGLLEGLGYKENKEQMKRLASLLPYKKLKKITDEIPAAERSNTIQALLLGTAGLLEEDDKGDHETASLLSGYKAVFAKNRKYIDGTMSRADWCFYRVRPPNFPQRRLYGAGFILDSALKFGFLNLAVAWTKTLSVLLSSEKDVSGALEGLKEIFAVGPKGYFASRAVFGPKWNAAPSSLIGPTRALSIIVNTVIPVMYRWCIENDPGLEKLLCDFYGRLPLLEPNRITKKMGHYLLGGYYDRNFKIKKERQSQGLIQIFQDFCGDKPQECLTCRLPEVMKYSIEEVSNP